METNNAVRGFLYNGGYGYTAVVVGPSINELANFSHLGWTEARSAAMRWLLDQGATVEYGEPPPELSAPSMFGVRE